MSFSRFLIAFFTSSSGFPDNMNLGISKRFVKIFRLIGQHTSPKRKTSCTMQLKYIDVGATPSHTLNRIANYYLNMFLRVCQGSFLECLNQRTTLSPAHYPFYQHRFNIKLQLLRW